MHGGALGVNMRPGSLEACTGVVEIIILCMPEPFILTSVFAQKLLKIACGQVSRHLILDNRTRKLGL